MAHETIAAQQKMAAQQSGAALQKMAIQDTRAAQDTEAAQQTRVAHQAGAAQATGVTAAPPDLQPLFPPQRRRIMPRVQPGWFGLVVIALVLLCALIPDAIAPHDPYEQDIMLRLRPPVWFAGGEDGYLLGTDQLGRDVLSRIIYGARETMLISTLAVAISSAIGLTLGLLAGFFQGLLDTLIARLIDMLLAFPILLLMIAVTAALGTSEVLLILVMGLVSWPHFARIVRASTISVMNLDFIDAAKTSGSRTPRILLRHVLPNILSVALVFTTSEFSRMILTEATLSFLGLGVQPPTPTWGGMITEAQPYIGLSWTPSLVPGIVLALTILSFNMTGEALRDRFDPRLAR
jgi:ABC-type dipeptide/oligopeptide/nickel transport system permease subunit